MKKELTNTTAADVAAALLSTKEELGAESSALALTLLIVVSDLMRVAEAVRTAISAAREHPCRIVVFVEGLNDEGPDRLDAWFKTGEGASEVVTLLPWGEAATAPDTIVAPLLGPDTPIVTWWPDDAPENPIEHPLGAISMRRITDSRECDNPLQKLQELAKYYTPGDSDLSWAGVTLWRANLMSLTEELPKAEITSVTVSGCKTHPAPFLIGAWISLRLEVPTKFINDPLAETVTKVVFHRSDGDMSLEREPKLDAAISKHPGRKPLEMYLSRRPLEDCLMEDLRRLDVDVAYGQVLTKGLNNICEKDT